MNVPLADLFVHDVWVNDAGRWVLIALAVVLGGVFGSFINVVAYRLPRRMSLIVPGSQCPSCGRAIRWHDNIPVVGWLMLRGRCRDCGVAILVRYPLVEAFVAVVAGLLAWKASAASVAEPIAAGAHAFDVSWFVFGLLLICGLVAAALAEFDGHVPPQRLFWVPLALGLVMAWLWPGLHGGSGPFGYEGVPAALWGMATAVAIGAGPWLIVVFAGNSGRLAQANAALAALVMVGGFLGQNGVVTIGVAGMAVYLAMQALARKWPALARFGWAGLLTIVTLVWLLAWHDSSFRQDPSTSMVFRLIVGGVIMSVLAIVLLLVQPGRRSHDQV